MVCNKCSMLIVFKQNRSIFIISFNTLFMKKIFLPVLALGLLFGSCRDEKKEDNDQKVEVETEVLGFAEVGLTPEDFSACDDAKCPEIRVNYLKFRKNQKVANTINTYNQEQIIKIFNNTEADSNAKSVKAAIEEFIADYQNFKKDFPESQAGYEIETSQNVLHQNKKLLVVETDFYLFTGGAHGYGATLYANFNSATGELLQTKDLFSKLSAFKDFAEKKFRKKYEILEDDNINSKGFFFENDTFALPENIGITATEVVLVYNQYEAASYAEGQLKLTFPKERVAQWLSDLAQDESK